jgi:2-keto-4-pentenoate hydratase/2-oxohepta-3-ene-1,7-dioic acid hydratase in catechol pathway
MKIICVARNYVDHAKEMNHAVPTEPVVFMKPRSALLEENKPFYYPEFTKELHYETEVVLKICSNGRHVEEKFAHKYYKEMTVGIDMTARDIQRKCKEEGKPWEISKSFDHSAVVGEMIPIEGFDPKAVEFSLKQNGEVVQQGNTKDVIFDFDFLISHVSQYFTLNIGDLLFTGTPVGVGEIAIGDKLEAFLGNRKLLDCQVK